MKVPARDSHTWKDHVLMSWQGGMTCACGIRPTRMQGFTSQVLSTVSNDRHSARSHKAATQLLISTSWVPGSKTCPCLLGITCTSRGRRIKKQCALGKTPPWETRVQEGSFPQLLSSQLQIQNTVFVLKGIFT